MRKVYTAYYNLYKTDGKSGITFLREAMKWFDYRPEIKNEGKAPIRLLMDFATHILELDREFKGLSKTEYYGKYRRY